VQLNLFWVVQAAKLEEKLKFITEKIPTRIMNTAGSNAGAGSGEFHMYRMVRPALGFVSEVRFLQDSVFVLGPLYAANRFYGVAVIRNAKVADVCVLKGKM
jgi:hypothetical protein